jgi:hypothetical protein
MMANERIVSVPSVFSVVVFFTTESTEDTKIGKENVGQHSAMPPHAPQLDGISFRLG